MTEPIGAEAGLNRTLGLPLVTLYGLGNILGAGIYVLVGKVAGFAGSSTILAFLIAMVTAAVTAMSYMELAGRYPVSGSVSVYLHRAFGKRWLSTAIGLTMVGGGVASAAALAQGFSGYLNSFASVPTIAGSVGLLVALGAIAIKGIGESATFAAVLTGLEVLGLALVIWFGRTAFTNINVGGLVAIDPAVGLGGVFAGAFLALYAFIGFARLHRVYQTPVTATLVVLAAMIAGTVLLPLVSLARLTSLLVLIIFTLVNLALIVIKRRHRDHGGYVTVPAAIPYLGVVLCLGTLVQQAFNW